MIKKIGRNDDNDFKINKDDISSNHCIITKLEDNLFQVEDLNSTNGTFVNGYRISKVKFTLKDELRLSKDTVINLSEVFNLNKKYAKPVVKTKQDYINDFNKLEEIWLNYKKDLKQIKQNHQRKQSFIRAGIMLTPLIIWYILQYAYLKKLDTSIPENLETIKFWQDKYLIFSVLGSTIGVLATSNSNIDDKIAELNEEFSVRYVCPNEKCRKQLGNQSWKSYKNQKKCFSCNAPYSE